MSRAAFVLTNPSTRDTVCRWVRGVPDGTRVFFKAPQRTLDQNSRLWALLTAVADQVPWDGKKRSPEAWKDIFTAALRSAKHELDVVRGIEGGFVLLGMHTSTMSKAEVGELMDLIEAFGAEHGVVFNEPVAA